MRLIDADALINRMYHDAFETDTDMQKWDSGCWIRYKMFENAIDEQPTIEALKAQEWIPCSERLPENANHLGALCPRYQVSTKFGVTQGWYNPDKGCWYVLVWFLHEGEWNTKNIDMKHGDVPKVVKSLVVEAWRPLPVPYKGGADMRGESHE